MFGFVEFVGAAELVGVGFVDVLLVVFCTAGLLDVSFGVCPTGVPVPQLVPDILLVVDSNAPELTGLLREEKLLVS